MSLAAPRVHASSNAAHTPRAVTFSVGDVLLALPVAEVVEIVRAARPTPVPGAPQGVSGLLDYRGRIVPVIDLRARFGLPFAGAQGADSARAIIAQNAAHTSWCALLVDAVHEIVDITDEPAPAGAGVPRALQHGLPSVRSVTGRCAADAAGRDLILFDAADLMPATRPFGARA